MQTKSPLVRIASVAGVALALVALIVSLKLQHHASSSQSVTSNHMAVTTQPATAPSASQKENFSRDYGKLPLAFEVNQGQTAPEVRYLAHGPSYQLFLTNQEAVLTLRQTSTSGKKSAKGASLLAAQTHRTPNVAAKTSVLRMHFDGANPAAEIAGTKLLLGKTNYFIGNDPKKWQTDVPSYEAVRYQGLYPGVDMLFYGKQQRLEYDFIVAPGADPKAIALSIAGARKLELNSQGDVLMSVAGSKVTLQKPVIYQDINGERREIAGNYTITNDRQIRFSMAAYDHTQPLTIDPVLTYSTYVGGESTDFTSGLALDAAGDAYIAGETFSTMFPQVNPESPAPPADVAVGTIFVAELNPTGTALIYSTYLGGSGNGSFGEGADAIALDTASPPNIYLTGFTGSPDFPPSTAPAGYDPTAPASANNGGSAFIAKLAPSAAGAAQLAYTSYLGGDINDEGHSIAVDAAGNAFIAGFTMSTTYPQHGTPITAGQTSADGNAFLTEINTTVGGTPSLVYSTYIGGSGTGGTIGFGDVANGVTIDASDNAYIVGATSSTDFPVMGTAVAGSAACFANGGGSAFITVVNTAAQTLTYSHCLTGNSGYDLAFGVSLGTGVPAVATKVAYITGTTGSTNFPVTAGSIPPPGGGVGNGVAFVSLLNTANGTLQYSSFLGGTNSDTGFSIASDSAGVAYVTGLTGSADFPITQGALQLTRNNPNGTAFIAKISPSGHGLADLVYSTYYGGQALNNALTVADSGQGIAVSATNAYVTGYMSAPDMLTTSGAFQTALGAAGATNAFVAELPLTPTISVSPTILPFGTQLIATPSQPQYVTITNNTANAIGLTLPPTSTNTDFVGSASGTTPCTASLAAGASCNIGVIFTPAAAGAEAGILKIFDALDGMSHPMQVALTGTGSGTAGNITITPTSLTLPGALLTTSSTGTVSIGNNGNAPLSIASVAAAPGVFTAAPSNTVACNSGNFPIVIAANGTPCDIVVTFSPVAATPPGPVSGSLTITQTLGNVTTVPLSGPAWDFSVSVATIGVTKGMSGTFPVIITGLGGFTGSVSFTCTPGALLSSCAVPTTAAAPAPGATATGQITATAFVPPPQSMKVPPSALLRQVLFIMLAIALLFMIPAAQRFRTRLGMVGAIMVVLVVAGCSGSPSQPQTSTVVITPSSGAVTKPAITVNVTVNP